MHETQHLCLTCFDCDKTFSHLMSRWHNCFFRVCHEICYYNGC